MQITISNKEIIRTAAPICISLLLPQITFLTNTAFLGRLGEFNLSVNGIAGVFYLALSVTGYGLNSGIQTLISRRAGQLHYQAIGDTLRHGIAINLCLAAGWIFFMKLCAAPILHQNLSSPAIATAAEKYLAIRIWGLPFYFMEGLLIAFFVSSGNARFIFYAALCTEAINIFFDYTLIFGHWGFPALGLNGAAYSAIIAETTSLMLLTLIFYYKRFYQQFSFSGHSPIRWQQARHIIQVASPVMVQYFISISTWLIFFIFIEHLGERPAAISNLMRSVFGCFGIFTWAFASTTNSMVSNIIGQGLENKVLPVVKKIIPFSTGCALFIALLLELFPDTILRFYSNDNGLIEAAIPSLRVVCLAALIMSVSTIFLNAVTGTGATKVNLLIEVSAITVYLIYVYFVVEHLRLPLVYAWGSEIVYWLMMLVLSFRFLKSGRWKKIYI